MVALEEVNVSQSRWFESSDGKYVLTAAGIEAVGSRMHHTPPDEFKPRFGASKPAFYKWLQGGPLSSRGREAVLKMLGENTESPAKPLEEYSIEELVAALKAKGVKDVQITL
jgi:hypothetical protein